MKTRITVQTDKFANVPWPDGAPLPAAGDNVVLAHAGKKIEFVVDQRSFGIEADPQGAEQTTVITIHGHCAPAGSV
jgi:hypothetical protein